MSFTFTHVNFNVLDLERSMAFYEKAFGFYEKRRMEAKMNMMPAASMSAHSCSNSSFCS